MEYSAISDALSSYDKVAKSVARLDYSGISNAVSSYNKVLQSAANLDYSGISNAVSSYNKVLQSVARLDYSGISNAISSYNKIFQSVARLDYSAISNAVSLYSRFFQSVARLDYSAMVNTCLEDEFIEKFASIEGITSEEDIQAIKDTAEFIKNPNKVTAPTLTDKQKKSFDTYIFPLILILVQFLLSGLTAQPSIVTNNVTYNTNYYSNEVNNYYTINQGFDSKFLNDNNLRFVCEMKIIVRKKANQSSQVVGILPVGKVVSIVDKRNKWVKICWSDESGEYYSGWVQNWKLKRFK